MAQNNKKKEGMMVGKKKFVFIGDSITESWREEDPENLGTGYVRMIHDYLLVTDPTNRPEIVNKGVSGNRITDLAVRWETDVIAENPDLISISIGINDVWRQLHSPDDEQVRPDKFEQLYRDLLTQVKENTIAEIILMEPTVIVEDIQSEGNKKLLPYIEIVHKLAAEFEATIVPTHDAFLNYLKKRPNYQLTIDGVHMNPAGNFLMAKTWLATYNHFSMEKGV